MRVSGASNGCSDIDLATGENPMTTLAKTLAAAVIGLSASMFAPITASAALSANATARCNAQVRAVWPQSGVEYERTKEDVFQACVLNGGRIP
jgi:hypothetical protein